MALLKIIILAFLTSKYVDTRLHSEREINSNICDPMYNNNNTVQCYCVRDSRGLWTWKSADCYLIIEDVSPDDDVWKLFTELNSTNKLTFINSAGVSFKYIPTKALAQTTGILKLYIKYGNIDRVEPFAFANMSGVEDISLDNNQIKVLDTYAFAHLRNVTTINLDTNTITEIDREVFVDLPSLEKLFLTGNKITTIHDRAFIYLTNLRELEINRNGLLSLNSETFSGLKKLQRLDLSSNSLEVIGDNTFLPLMNLQTLNLEGNKLQILDDRAFNGLSKLYALSLARNKLIHIVNVKVFEGLNSLCLLNLQGNMINELKAEGMAPILRNFYGNSCSINVEDNNFPCDCRLDWFVSLMNKTQNLHLKQDIVNLKCFPDAKLLELWFKIEETDKNVEYQESQEHYNYDVQDSTQGNETLFYIDIKYLINCTTNENETSSAVITELNGTTTKYLLTTEPTHLISVSQAIRNENVHDEGMVTEEAILEEIKAHPKTQGQDTDTASLKANNANRNVAHAVCVILIILGDILPL